MGRVGGFRLSLVAWLALLGPVSANAATHRYAIVIGASLGSQPERRLRFAERDADNFAQALVDVGEFERDNIAILRQPTADGVREAVKKANAKLAATQVSGVDSSLLIVYYSGHADGDVLELGRTELPYRELTEWLSSSPATVRLAFIDACQSGQLVATKGARRRPEFNIRVTDQLQSSGYAVLTSSAENELSQESESIRGSYFTHFVISGLRGAADSSRDGKVTLGELHQFTYQSTLANTAATMGGSQHPMYEFKLRGKGEIVLASSGPNRANLVVKPGREGRLIVLSKNRDAVLAETTLGPSDAAQLVLPQGEYVVFLLSSGGTYAAPAKLAAANTLTLDSDSDFVWQQLRVDVAKGGLFRPTWLTRWDVLGLVRRWPWGDFRPSFGGAVDVRLESPSALQLVMRGQWSTRSNLGASKSYHDFGLSGGLGYLAWVGNLGLRPDVLLGAEYMRQADRQGARRSLGFIYVGTVSAVLPTSFGDLSLGLGAGGRMFRERSEGNRHALDVQVTLGMGGSRSF